MDPLNPTGTPTAGAQTTPAAGASPPPPAPAPTPSPTPAPASPSPGSGPGLSGATPAAGAGAPSAGVAPSPAAAPQVQQPAANPADPFAGLNPQMRSQIAEWQRQAQQFQAYQHLIPLGYRAYQQAAVPAAPAGGQPAQTQPANPWGLPAIDRNLLNYVAKDPNTGQLVTLPGGPPDAAIRVAEYQQKLQDLQWKLFNNPEELIGPLVEKRAKDLFQQQFSQQFGQIQQQQQAGSILQRHADWLYEKDSTGQPVQRFDPATGQMRPQLSGWGRYYAQLVQQADAGGLKDPVMQDQWATAQIQAAVYRAQLQQATAPQQGAAAAQQFVQQAAQAPPAAGPTPNQVVPNQPPPTEDTLRQRMLAAFQGNGLTDQAVTNQINRVAA